MRISGDVVIPCLSHSLSTQQQLQSLWLDNLVGHGAFSNLESLTESVCNTSICGPQPWQTLRLLRHYFKLNRQQQYMKCGSDSEWMRERPGFALNMRAIRDSCQPSATLGGNQSLNGFKSLSVSWHNSCCPMHILLQVFLQRDTGPLNESSLQFQLCPVLAHFH